MMLRVSLAPFKRAAAASLLGAIALGVPAMAAPISLKSTANAVTAAPATTGFGRYAIIHVSVTNPATGLPVATLGPSIGTGAGLIALPPGWGLVTFSTPPGSLGMRATRFVNHLNGVYSIQVVNHGVAPSVAGFWRKGEYHYAVRFGGIVAGTLMNGTDLSVLEVPHP